MGGWGGDDISSEMIGFAAPIRLAVPPRGTRHQAAACPAFQIRTYNRVVAFKVPFRRVGTVLRSNDGGFSFRSLTKLGVNGWLCFHI